MAFLRGFELDKLRDIMDADDMTDEDEGGRATGSDLRAAVVVVLVVKRSIRESVQCDTEGYLCGAAKSAEEERAMSVRVPVEVVVAKCYRVLRGEEVGFWNLNLDWEGEPVSSAFQSAPKCRICT